MVQMGTYEELLESSSIFAQLREDIHQHDREQQSISFTNQRSMIDSINSEEDNLDEEDIHLLPINIETKYEGTVKWNVYIAYLRAGIGIFSGSLLIIMIFATQQTITIYSNWWLAVWSNDESYRYQNWTNCMDKHEQHIERIHQMNDMEWNAHRDRQFYIFCRQLTDEIVLFSILFKQILVLVFVLSFLIFLRTAVSRLICLNAGRVIHNMYAIVDLNWLFFFNIVVLFSECSNE